MDITKPSTTMRYIILKKLEQYIYMPVTTRLNAVLYDIVRRNDSFSNSDKRVFWYRGEKWSSESYPSTQGVPRLHEELHPAMDDYIVERNYIRDVEGPLVVGFLRCILNHSKDAAEMLRLIPVALQVPLKEVLAQIPGERPSKSTDEVATLIGAPKDATEALKMRMMRNLLEG